MRILVCGMPRSGSTVCCTLLNNIFKINGMNSELVYIHNVKNIDHLYKISQNKNIVLKIHEFNEPIKFKSEKYIAINLIKWADIVVLTNRSLKYSVASMIRKKIKANKKIIKCSLDQKMIYYNIDQEQDLINYSKFIVNNCYKKWIYYHDYIFYYEEYILNTDKVLDNLKSLISKTNINYKNIINLSNLEILDSLNNLNNVEQINNEKHITSKKYDDYLILKQPKYQNLLNFINKFS